MEATNAIRLPWKALLVLMLAALLTLPGGHAEAAPANEVKKLTASDAQDDDLFGTSVTVDGDTAIVGAYWENGEGLPPYGGNRGAAYIFQRDQGGAQGWGEVQKITASDPADWSRFGRSVSVSGETAIVGALNGLAYIFQRALAGRGSWSEVKRLTVSGPGEFGGSVALSGDTAIVGARYTEGGGAAYIFQRDQGGPDNWGQVKKLTASDAEDADAFGISVALSGDVAIVGAFLEDGAGGWEANRGAAYIFQRNLGGADNWGEVGKLTASDAENTDYFGESVTLNGDTAIVGAYFEDGAGSDRGAAYIYQRDQGGPDSWGEVKKLTASHAQDWDHFGGSVALHADTAIISAAGEDGTGSDQGAAYVFERHAGGANNWGNVMKLRASDAEDYDDFGGPVAISSAIAVVAAFGEDGAGSDRGAAYVFAVGPVGGIAEVQEIEGAAPLAAGESSGRNAPAPAVVAAALAAALLALGMAAWYLSPPRSN